MQEEQSKIPVSKIKRAMSFAKTGVKVGGNYLKHYTGKLLNGQESKETLDEKNAEEIYRTLSKLKGSALKVAQTFSMDRGLLPAAYSRKFVEAQYNAPPLSGPLIVKTFRQHFGKSPLELYDAFDPEAVHAASMGQVHRAMKGQEVLAVKIQYPGVGESVVSDLNMIKPLVKQIFGFKEQEIKLYFEEVKARLLEEADYELELERSMTLAAQCRHLPHVHFARYYPSLSCKRVISMSWLQGMHLDQFLQTQPSQQVRDQLGQALWDFYAFQLHKLQLMHADAHPGNFLFREDGSVGIIDFGCVKAVPKDFYQAYFTLIQPGILNDWPAFIEGCRHAGMILPGDTEKEIQLYGGIFHKTLSLVCKPFHQQVFDFGDEAYFDEIYAYGEKIGRSAELRQSPPRGSRHGIYLNRAFFGLYSILNQLKARVHTQRYIN